MFKKVLLTVGLFFVLPLAALAEGMPGARSATNESGDVFLGGNYIEVGISKGGSFGTSAPAPESFHSHAIGKNDFQLGLIADGDGWDNGNDPTDGDFFLPGTPEERYILSYKIDGVTYNHYHADRNHGGWIGAIEKVTTVDASDVSKGELKAIVTGITKENVKMELIYSFNVDDKYYKTEVKITNLSDKTLTDVRFVRSFDPDQDVDIYGDYDTYNKVVCNPVSSKEGGEDNYSMVVARGINTLDGFFFVSFDNRARSSRGVSFEPESAYLSGFWPESTPGLPTYSTTENLAINPPSDLNGYVLEDDAIAITTNLGELTPNNYAETNYYSSLDPDVINSIGNILKAVAAKVKGLSDTRIEVETQEGYEYSIDNGTTWQDSGVFEGLEPGKEYVILSRIKATDETPASEPEETKIVTKNSSKDSPQVFETIVTEDEVVINHIPGYEYSIDGGKNWQKSPTFTGLKPDTVYTIIARYEETFTDMPGNPTEPIVVRTPKRIETALDDATNVSIDITVKEDAPGVTIHKGLLYEAIMNDETIKEAVENGDNVNILFEVKSITIENEDKIKENYPSKTIAFSVDATLKLFVNDSFVKDINTSEKKIYFTLRIPKEYQKKNRTFTIVRKHINENDEVEYESFIDEDSSDETITISSDKFSEFIILYEDMKNPKTGDNILIFVGIVIVCIIVLVILKRKKD